MAKKSDESTESSKTKSDASAANKADTKSTSSSGSQSATSKKKTRIERDLLGEMEVPNDVYYGVHTMRAIDNFQISWVTINNVPEFIRGMVMVKKAAAMANRRLHTLPKKKQKPSSGPVTRSWKKAGAWTNSRSMFSKAAPEPRSI